MKEAIQKILQSRDDDVIDHLGDFMSEIRSSILADGGSFTPEETRTIFKINEVIQTFKRS